MKHQPSNATDKGQNKYNKLSFPFQKGKKRNITYGEKKLIHDDGSTTTNTDQSQPPPLLNCY
jgi:hypothetical protein